MKQNVTLAVVCAAAGFAAATPAFGFSVIQYGDRDVLGTGTYPGDPTAGAALTGLAPNVVTYGAPALAHSFPFSPSSGDYPGTDQIYVSSVQTSWTDGYANYSGRVAGPHVITMNYNSAVPLGHVVTSLTLGIAFDDFQQVPFHRPYTVMINGAPHATLTGVANSLDQTGPRVQFISVGIDPSLLLATHILTLTIDQGGDGADGWAIDFLTIGVETAVPGPGTAVGCMGLLAMTARRRRR